MEVTTCKISKSEAKELYNKLMQKDIDILTKEKSNDIRKYNILDILCNADSIFTGPYFHYKDMPERKKYCKENKIKKRKVR